MAAYAIPEAPTQTQLPAKQVYLVANGDLRLSANQNCWAAQQEMETANCRRRRKCRLEGRACSSL